jgi:tetratricopeptide (TPR) repeat protein
MSNPAQHSKSPPSSETDAANRSVARNRPPIWLAAIILALAIAIVYGRGLNAPFMFDDDDSIVTNTSIRSIWPLIGSEELRGPLNPVRDIPTSARPVVNYSFALNYHFGGLRVRGYHLVNVGLHYLSALLAFAVIRRSLKLPYFAGRFDSAAGWIAFAVALLWSLHPLNTEAVEYITQRTELMMALFYLATFYCALRYWSALPVPLPFKEACGEQGRTGLGEDSATPREQAIHPYRPLWLTLATIACLGGMLSKEVMVSAPIMVLLFERTFLSGSFANALRRSWPLYVGLALTWTPLFVLSANSPRSYSSGFHLNASPFVWWFTQCKVLLMYLKLAIWPWPLRCAYELPKVENLVDFIIYVLPVLLLAALAITLVLRNHPVGFVLTFIAAVLAPTSIMPIMTEMAAERRMYLPLVAIVSLAVVGAYLFAMRQWKLSIATGESSPDSKTPGIAAFVSVAAIACLYGAMSAQRLSAYYDELLMWQQVAESQPMNHMAYTKVGLLYNRAGREAESLAALKKAVEVHPGYPNGQSAYGFALINAGHLPEAIEHIKAALDVKPDHVGALNNMGIALTRMGQYPEAIEYLQRAIRIDPTHADAHNNLGQALLKAGRTDEA